MASPATCERIAAPSSFDKLAAANPQLTDGSRIGARFSTIERSHSTKFPARAFVDFIDSSIQRRPRAEFKIHSHDINFLKNHAEALNP